MVADECLSLYGAPFWALQNGGSGAKVKLHTITLLPINIVLSARITPGSRHDSSAFGETIGNLRGPGLTLGDAAFLSEENIAKYLKRRCSQSSSPMMV